MIGVVIEMNNVGGLTAANEYEKAGQAIGTALGLGFWGMIWFSPTVGLGILALVTRLRGKNVDMPESKLCQHCEKYYTGCPAHCPNCGSGISEAKNCQKNDISCPLARVSLRGYLSSFISDTVLHATVGILIYKYPKNLRVSNI